MNRLLRPLFALPVIACVLVIGLVSGVISHMSALKSGQEIIIPAQGYDPRDPLLGHYVTLRPDTDFQLDADASARAKDEFDLTDDYWQSRQGWAVLEKSGDIWRTVQVSRERPDQQSSASRVLVFGDLEFRKHELESRSQDTLSVRPPIDVDRYYVHADEAKALEALLRQNGSQDQQSRIDLILSVTDDGKALLKGVRIAGERQMISWY